MPLTYTPTQQTFLGCSITGYNCSFEWGSGGTLTVGLVEDNKHYDELYGPVMGFPARFQYDSYIFDGILNDFSVKRGSGGNRTLEATLIGPAQILDGVQVIFGGYTGTVATLYNLYNVYGQLESTGFGNSGVNDVGIPWYTLVSTLENMVSSWPIRFNGVPYYLDLGELPHTLPTYYRVAGNSLSLSEIVSELCDAAGYDFFFDLYGNIIKLRTVNRQYQPNFGLIQQFIDQNTEGKAISTDIGYQVEYNTTGRFISGGQVEKIYLQNNNLLNTSVLNDGEIDDYIANFGNQTILPYFGLTSNGSVVMPKSIKYDWVRNTRDNAAILAWRIAPTSFPDLWYVNSNSISGGGLAFPDGYPLTIDEMRYALVGQKEWENFIVERNISDKMWGLHRDINPYKGFNDMLEIDAEISQLIKNKLIQLSKAKLLKLKPIDIINLDKFNKIMSVKGQRVYEFVRNFATEYFGRKFMVALPSLYVKRDTDTGLLNSSYELSDSGYIDESLFTNAVGNGYLPSDYNFVTTDENKLQCYVKFTGYQAAELNLSNLAPSDYSVTGNAVFVRCDIDPTFVFLNANNLTSPRAIITLPAPISATEYETTSTIINIVRQELFERNGVFPGNPWNVPDDLLAFITNQIDTFLANIVAKIGFDILREPIPPIPLIPAMAAIPVKSNTETYGPWYYTGSNGKIEYEQNPDLVPWNFGGYTQMNLMANSMVTQAISSRFVSEAGSIEIPGSPLCRTGDELIAGGPYVTGLSISSDARGGVTTSYRFNSWNVKYGKVQRYVTERFKKILELERARKRQIRELFKPKGNVLTSQVRLAVPTFTRRLKANTSHDVIMGENRSFDGATDTTISIMPYYNAMNATQDGDTYSLKGGFTLDGLFRPYSTDVSSSGLGKFQTSSGIVPTVNDLNPLKAGHDIGAMITGSGRPNDIKNDGATSGGRGIALKGPLVLSGWGYDIDGKPVPNSTPSNPGSGFTTNYLTQAESWKTGPVDLRWDNTRGLWTGGDVVRIKKFTFQGSGNYDYLGNDGILTKGSGLAYMEGNTSSNTQYIIDQANRNFLIRSDNVMCIFSNNNWYIVGENGLHRSARANTAISFNAAGPCKLKTNTDIFIESYFDWMGKSTDSINANSQLEIRYVVEESRWRITGAACND